MVKPRIQKGVWRIAVSQKSETMNHLKTITMVSMETKFSSQDSIFDKLSENITWVDSEKGNRVFTRGGLCDPPPPPRPPKLQKSLPWIGLSLEQLWSTWSLPHWYFDSFFFRQSYAIWKLFSWLSFDALKRWWSHFLAALNEELRLSNFEEESSVADVPTNAIRHMSIDLLFLNSLHPRTTPHPLLPYWCHSTHNHPKSLFGTANAAVLQP